MLKRYELALGFLVATAFWSVVFVLQSDTSAHYQICETNQYTEHESCASHHLPYVALWYIGYVVNTNTITAIATAFIAVFTLTLWRSTRDLWQAGERQLRLIEANAIEQSKGIKASIIEAQRSADAAREAVMLAKRTAEQELRAYIGINGARIVSPDGGNTFVVEIEIANSGQTPAFQVTHRIAAEIQVQHGEAVAFQEPERGRGEWVMAPNSVSVLKRDIPIGGASGTSTVDTGYRTIFAWGQVNYVDVFGQIQTLTFRFQRTRSIRKHDGTVMRTVGWEMEPEDQGNTST